ncbi:MAG: peptide ABC transporter substrate-binding protein [Chloroflexota bacterium]
MKRANNWSYHIFIFGLLIVLAGCQNDAGITLLPSSNQSNETINLSGGQPRTMDPALTLGGPSGALGHVFSGLTALDANLQVQPELAAGWTVSEDGRIYTFYLHENAVFHNGRAVTASDVVFSWERAADPALGSDTAQTYLGDIAGVMDKINGRSDTISGLRVIDEHTLEVTLAEPVVYFLAKIAYPVAYIVDEQTVETPNWEREPNGTGPFRLASWQDDERMALVRHDDYYGDPAFVQRVVYDLGPSLSFAEYEQGNIDLVGVGGANLDRVQDPNSPFISQLKTGVSMCTTSIGLNAALVPLDDVRVRQAFSMAIDREQLINAFWGGDALLANGSLPPGMPGFNIELEGVTFDPEGARQLLNEAGFGNPADLPRLTYTTSGFGEVSDFVTAVIIQWQTNLGVQIEPQVIEPFQYYDEIYAGNVGHFFGSGWCADYPDPQNFLDILYHSESPQNNGNFSNPQIDTLLEQARVERDTTARLALYADIEQLIVNEAPEIFIAHGLTAVLVSPDLIGYQLAPIGVRQWHRVSVER